MRVGASRLDAASGMSASFKNGVENTAGDDMIEVEQHGRPDADGTPPTAATSGFWLRASALRNLSARGSRPLSAALRKSATNHGFGRTMPVGDQLLQSSE